LSKMALQGIEWLHQHRIVHRDIKGLNMLVETPDLHDPRNRLVLCDFGTAVRVRPGQRLTAPVGTLSHWAPEQYAHDYGIKVDCWAMGVTSFRLIWQVPPFGENGAEDPNQIDAEAAWVGRLPIRSRGEPCALVKDWILGMLRNDEEQRTTALQGLEHGLMSEMKPRTDVARFYRVNTDCTLMPEEAQSWVHCLEEREPQPEDETFTEDWLQTRTPTTFVTGLTFGTEASGDSTPGLLEELRAEGMLPSMSNSCDPRWRAEESLGSNFVSAISVGPGARPPSPQPPLRIEVTS